MIAGAGFAWMAWRLACLRVHESHPSFCAVQPNGPSRNYAAMADHEYYRIIDKAWLLRYDHHGRTIRL